MDRDLLVPALGELLGSVPETTGPVHSATVSFTGAGIEMEGYLAHPAATDDRLNPAVLVLHDWYGMADHVRVRAEMLARLGYVALAGDVYGVDVRPDGDEEAHAAAGPFYDDPVLFRSRLQANLTRLLEEPTVDPTRVAVVGYCFGGTGALELARSGAPVEAAVCLHGFLSTAAPASPGTVDASVLVLTGADDPLVPASQVGEFEAEMTGAGVADWQVVRYGGVMHGFALPEADAPEMGVQFQPRADRRAWAALQDFLAETLAAS